MTEQGLYPGNVGATLEHCRRALKLLTENRMEFDDFAYDYAIHAAATTPSCVEALVDMLPEQFVPEMVRFLDEFLVPVDFMPCPAPFIPGTGTSEQIEAMKQRLRPMYVHLYECIKARCQKLADASSSH